MDKNEFRDYVAAHPKLVSMKESTGYPGLYVLKYSRKVFYDGLWNDFLENCRGTVIDADFNVISRPFTKIYNFRVEDKSPVLSDDTMVSAYRKVNGFMAALSWHNNDILVSTTGSLDSDFVGYIKEMMLTHQSWADWQMEILAAKGHTLMFECVHPIDPHICPEDIGMYFLGLRENAWDSEVKTYGKDMIEWARTYATANLKCKYAEGTMLTVGELVSKSKEVDHEGFVAYTEDGQSFKIKSPHYLCLKALARKKDILSLNKQLVEEEYYPLVAHLNSMREEFNSKPEQERLEYIREYLSVQ